MLDNSRIKRVRKFIPCLNTEVSFSEGDEQFSVITDAMADGIFVRRKKSIWSGSMQWLVDKDGADKRRVKKYNLPELRKAKLYSYLINKCFSDYAYETYYGYFVPRDSIKPFQAEISDLKRMLGELVDKIENERERINVALREDSYKYTEAIWHKVYKHEGNPPPSFAMSMADEHVANFPSGYDLRRRFKLEIIPCNPVCEPGSRYEAFFGSDINSKVTKAIYISILHKRAHSLRYVDRALVGLNAECSKSKRNNQFKQLMLRARSITRQNFYGDKVVGEAAENLFNALIVTDERSVDKIKVLTEELFRAFYDDDNYLIRHMVES